jgi:arsenate reductase-like glutaredoxin family protein
MNNQKFFTIEIYEVRKKKVCVKAKDKDEAETLAYELHDVAEIELDDMCIDDMLSDTTYVSDSSDHDMKWYEHYDENGLIDEDWEV